jgi:hypothetical protein
VLEGEANIFAGEGIISYHGCVSCQSDLGFFRDVAAPIKGYVLLSFSLLYVLMRLDRV